MIKILEGCERREEEEKDKENRNREERDRQIGIEGMKERKKGGREKEGGKYLQRETILILYLTLSQKKSDFLIFSVYFHVMRYP